MRSRRIDLARRDGVARRRAARLAPRASETARVAGMLAVLPTTRTVMHPTMATVLHTVRVDAALVLLRRVLRMRSGVVEAHVLRRHRHGQGRGREAVRDVGVTLLRLTRLSRGGGRSVFLTGRRWVVELLHVLRMHVGRRIVAERGVRGVVVLQMLPVAVLGGHRVRTGEVRVARAREVANAVLGGFGSVVGHSWRVGTRPAFDATSAGVAVRSVFFCCRAALRGVAEVMVSWRGLWALRLRGIAVERCRARRFHPCLGRRLLMRVIRLRRRSDVGPALLRALRMRVQMQG